MKIVLTRIVLNHSRSNRIFKQNLSIKICALAVLRHDVIGDQVINLVKRFPITEQCAQVCDFFLKLGNTNRFFLELMLENLSLCLRLPLECFFGSFDFSLIIGYSIIFFLPILIELVHYILFFLLQLLYLSPGSALTIISLNQ